MIIALINPSGPIREPRKASVPVSDTVSYQPLSIPPSLVCASVGALRTAGAMRFKTDIGRP